MKLTTYLSDRLEKVSFAGDMLSPNREQWGSEVKSKALEKFPWLNKYIVTSHLEGSSDDGKSAGFLQVVPKNLPSYVSSPKETPILTIPVIITDNILEPLDLIAFKGKLLPLTEARVNFLLRYRDTFTEADSVPLSVPLHENGDTTEDLAVSAREMQGSSPLSSLSGVKLAERAKNIEPEDLDEVITNFVKTSSKTGAVEARKDIDGIKVRSIYEITPSNSTFSPWEKISSSKALSSFGSEKFASLLEKGYVVATEASREERDLKIAVSLHRQEKREKVAALPTTPIPIKSLDYTKTYLWLGPKGWFTGKPVKAFRLATSYESETLSGNSTLKYDEYGIYILLGDGTIVTTEQSETKPVQEAPTAISVETAPKLIKARWMAESTGCFAVKDDDGSWLLARYDKKSVYKDRAGNSFYNTGFGHIVATSASVKSPWFDTSKETPILYIPSGSKSLTIDTVSKDEMFDATETTSSEQKEFKTNIKIASPVKGKFNIKTAFDVSDDVTLLGLNEAEAASALVAVGLGAKTAEFLVEQSASSGESSFLIENPVTTKVATVELLQKAAELRKKVAGAKHEFEKSARLLTHIAPAALTKAAEEIKTALVYPSIDDSYRTKISTVVTDSVDIALGMKYLNASTLVKFTEFIPDLEKTLSQICTLLLASRMGLNEVPKDRVKDCMEALDQIVSGLRKVEYQLII